MLAQQNFLSLDQVSQAGLWRSRLHLATFSDLMWNVQDGNGVRGMERYCWLEHVGARL